MSLNKTEIDHMARQRKKAKPGNLAYFSKGDKTKGIVDMHPIGEIKLASFKWISLNEMFLNLLEENEKLRDKFRKQKEINKGLNNKLKIIEGKLNRNGIK